MNLTTFRRVAATVLVAMLVLAGWGLTQVSADALVPIHWGPDGKADGFAPPLVAFLMLPATTLGIVLLLELVPRVEPRRENLRRSASAYRTVSIAIVLLFGAVQAFVVLSGVGVDLPVNLVFGAGVGALFVVIGNVMGTVRSNYMFGVRTPWTLASDRSWDRTHRLVGRLFVLGGIGIAVAALALPEPAMFVAIVSFVVAILVAAFWYSYRVWKSDPDRRDLGTSR